MKKSLSLLLLLCILCGSLVLYAFAETGDDSSGNSGQDTSATTGVDVVIVLDQSNSMVKRDDKQVVIRSESSDPDNYRLDATAMLIGMLDMKQSRVAIIPFNQKVIKIENSDANVLKVRDWEDRKVLIGKIYALEQNLNGGTDYGTALLEAIHILTHRDLSGDFASNQPMIVLMTDGYNDMKNLSGVSPNATQEANEKTQEAVNLAQENGIPIYTVVLDANPQSNRDGLSMEEISDNSGAGADGSIGAGKNPNKLPSFFAKVLAARIGSSTTYNANEGMVYEDGLYKIKLPIFNDRIREANIIIPINPKGNLNRDTIKSSIKIKKDGQDQDYSYYADKGNFAIIKLRNENGDPLSGDDNWVLEYSNSTDPSADISLLYNYDIKLNAELNLRDNEENRTTWYKNDVLTLKAVFLDPPSPDPFTGEVSARPSTDTKLYAKHPDDNAWGTIKASYLIKNEFGTIITHGTVDWEEEEATTEREAAAREKGVRLEASADLDKFEGEIDLSEFLNAGTLPAGTYTVDVMAKGAGLKRYVRNLTFEIVNRAPETTRLVNGDTYTYEIKVNREDEDQETGDSWGKLTEKTLGTEREGSQAITAEELFNDPDGEPLTFTLTQEPGEDDILILKLGTDNGKTIIKYTTKQETGQRKNKSGTATATLKADDGDGGTKEIQIKVDVVSQSDDFWGNHEIRILTNTYEKDPKDTGKKDPNSTDKKDAIRTDVQGPTENHKTFKKHQKVTFWIYLAKLDENGNVVKDEDGKDVDATLDELNAITPELTVKKGSQEVTLKLLEADSQYPNRIRYQADTGSNKADWKITLTCYGKEITETIKIQNDNAPAVKEDVPTGNITVKRAGGWAGALIGSDTPSQDLITGEEIDEKSKETFLVIYPKNIFSDEDGDELKLKDSDPDREKGVISAPRFYKPGTDEELPEDMIKASLEGDHYRIEYSAENTGIWDPSYKCEMRITAVDEDGLETTYTRLIEVQNLHKKVLGIALAILILLAVFTILFLIIHQIRKPRFPMLNMTIREEPSLFTSASETLSPVKTPTNVNAMGVDSDMAARHNVSMELLQNVVVKPIRSAVSVGVSCRKMIGGHEVTLEDVKLKPKKQYTWKLEQELIIRNMNGEGMIAIKLEDRSGDNEADDVMSAFGGEDGWSSSDPGMANATYSASKHSRKVKKKAVQTEEDNAMGGGNDDFDF